MGTSSHVDRSNPAFLASKRLSGFERLRRDLAHMVGRWRSRNRWRNDLAELLQTDPRLIADIGLEPNQVRREIAKPFWRF
jgi:uncharacterized protein YjiS (DUF1127 family)